MDPNLDKNLTTFEQIETRDNRFQQILYEQFGENGLVTMLNQSLIFIFALVMLVAILIGYITTLSKSTTNSTQLTNTGTAAVMLI